MSMVTVIARPYALHMLRLWKKDNANAAKPMMLLTRGICLALLWMVVNLDVRHKIKLNCLKRCGVRTVVRPQEAIIAARAEE